jgi:pimeloyl-ACP methyl ester carboxylesterase
MPIATIRGLAVHYELHGAGRPLLLLHNDGLNIGVWRALLPHLARSFRVVSYDRPGHGKSDVPPPEPPYTHEVGAADLATLLEALAIGRPVLFGVSGGALVATAFTLAHPGRVPALVLAEPPMLGLGRDFPIDPCGFTLAACRRALETGGTEAAVRAWLSTVFPPPRLEVLFRSSAGKSLTGRAPHVLLQFLQAAETFAPGPRLREITCPVLLLTGERTSNLFRSVERALAGALPRFTAVTLPGVDHANVVHPTPALLEALRAFFAAHLDAA